MRDRQTEKQKNENQTNKMGKMLLFLKVITEVVRNSYKGSFITEVYFSFFDNLKAFHEIFRCCKVYFVNYIIPVLKACVHYFL